MCRYPMAANQNIVTPDWEEYLDETAKQILEQQSPQRCCIVTICGFRRALLHAVGINHVTVARSRCG